MEYNLTTLTPVLPEIFLLSAACLILVIDLFLSERTRLLTYGLSLVALLGTSGDVAEFDVGDFGLARLYYRKLIEEYPKEQRVFLAKQELKRMDEMEIEIRRQMSDVRSQTERGSEERK